MILDLLAQVGAEAAVAGAARKHPRLRRFVYGTVLALTAFALALAWL